MPDIGDFKEVEVIEVMVAVGDTIKAEQSLITVESDKASMEIPSQGGVVKEVKVKVGDKVAKGSVVVVVEGSAPAAAARPGRCRRARAWPRRRHRRLAAARARPAPAAALEDANLKPGQLPHASPSVRKFARELGVNLSKVKGSGPGPHHGRRRARLRQAGAGSGRRRRRFGRRRRAGPLAVAKVDFTKFGPIEAKPLSRIKKISGANLHRNWVMIPHVTNNDEADITDLEARVTLNKENEKSGIKVTMLAFLIKRGRGPEEVPRVQRLAGRRQPGAQAVLPHRLRRRHAQRAGGAVIRDADKKGILQIAQEMTDLSKKARDGKISPADMQGGCFDLVAGRHRRHLVHAHHQCARSGHPGRVAFVARRSGTASVRAAPDRAAVAVL